ncbi:simple sugar transport system substrate-binding protein [Treponema bryantii]|uniref:Simple sugar transport system substrate-binding protein n=1 Tax=Treponema bryantii TaxID=163 RepID=A0A1I3KTH2_9SPIR|nr:BMP family ABC transporter substrate-binding protein [Treponema bryantii]SFI75680.1 simple sugar transport system substrate-binding protein [Treponema bryantii]
MKKILLFTTIFAAFLSMGFAKAKKADKTSIAVFVPGIIDDSPVYNMLVQGVKAAVEEKNQNLSKKEKIDLFIMEAGTNQAEWGPKITALCAEMKYDVIISSNPSLPELVEPILKTFPKQKFILMDATKEGNQNIHTVCYNQYEQSYLTGYIGGLMSKSHKLALIAAQEYPVMNNIILPYFEKGAKAANAVSTVDFRIVGNWYDATKGAELADAVAKKGVDVILPICGGASQGVINSAVNNGIYVTWFDDNGFAKAPGTIISSSVMKQKEMAYNVTKEFIEGTTPWGTADMVGIKEGYVDFVQDDPNYIKAVPADIREKMSKLVSDLRSGKVEIK